MAGRPPKPTAFKTLMGNPGRRPLNANEPKPVGGIPDPPYELDPIARDCWDRTAAALDSVGLLSKIDGDALANYATSWSLWIKCKDWLEKNGQHYVIKNDGGDKVVAIMPWPETIQYRKLLDVLHRFQTSFGLNPSARTKLEVKMPDAADDALAPFLRIA